MPGDRLPQEQHPTFRIETIKGLDGTEVSYAPDRGGIITSIKLKGTEILYMDMVTFNDSKANVKGGVPVLFPNAGPIESPEFPGLKQHGFARDLKWQAQHTKTSFFETLRANDSTKESFPYDFLLSIGVKLGGDGSISLVQSVTNQGKETLPVSSGLHPYFKVPGGDKGAIKFNFPGGDVLEKSIEGWSNGETIKAIKIDNPKVLNPNAVMEVVIPGLGTLLIDVSPEYKRIWVWSQQGKDFICVEPVMRDAGGLADDPEQVAPGSVLNAEVKIKLIKNP